MAGPGNPSLLSDQLSSWEPRGAGGEPLSDYLMFQGPEGEERLAGLFGGLGGGRERPGWTGQPIKNTGYVPAPGTEGDRGLAMQAGMNLPGAFGRPNDLMQPIGGLTQPQQQQALQVGLGALQGPTQQKIQQGIGALV